MEEKKKKNYQIVGNALAQAKEFTTVKQLADQTGLSKKIVESSIPLAKFRLAEKGIIIVNEMGKGYKRGNFKEFSVEVDKSCKRAIAQIRSMIKLVGYLKRSNRVQANFNSIDDVLIDNIKSLRSLFDEHVNLKPEFLDELARGEYDNH